VKEELSGASAPAAPASVLDAPGTQAQTPPSGPEHLTLSDALKECLVADPQIRAGAELIPQAQADLWTASLLPNPSVSTGTSLFPLGQSFNVNNQGGPPQFEVSLGFPIDWLVFGKRSAARESARTGIDATAAEFADLVRQRLAGTAEAFFDVLQAEAFLDLARQDYESLGRLQSITEELVRLGGAGTIEVDRVRVVYLDSEREVRQRESDVAVAKAALLAQIGRSTSEADFDVDGGLEVPSPVAPIPIDDAFHVAEKVRPDLVALQLRIQKAENDLRVEQTKAFPDVTPRLDYARQFQQQANGFPDVSTYGVGVDFSLPVSDRNQGNIEKARSVARQSRENLRSQTVQVRSEVAQASRDFRFAYESVTSDAPRRIAAARNARDKIEMAYRLGGRPLIDVLDAQRTFRDTQRLEIQDRASYWKSLYRLNAAVGKEVLR